MASERKRSVSARNLIGGLLAAAAAAALLGWAAGSLAVAAMTAAVSLPHVLSSYRGARLRGAGWFAFPFLAGLLLTGVACVLRRFYESVSG